MQTGHKRWTAFASATAAVVAIGCGDLTTDTAPGGAGDPSVETKAAAVETKAAAVATPSGGLEPHTRFFIPPPNPGAVQQIVDLAKGGKLIDAARVTAMEATPHAVWFTDGSPSDVKAAVRKTVKAAALLRTVPALVAYNIPFRDCAQYSAGGAIDAAAYKRWIEGFAAGIGNEQVVVILEPDGLGIIPFNGEWCQPMVTDERGNRVPAPGADPATRYELMNFAIDKLAKSAPHALVYLDGTHSAWLGVGDIASRLANGGVARAAGFFLNSANYQFAPNLVQYGTWLSSCLTYATSVAPGDFGSCPNQYWNGGPLPSKIAVINGPWNGVALDANGQWSDASDTVSLNTSGINLRYANMLGATPAAVHFVIDTSRNGLGPLNVTPFGAAPYNQPAGVLSALAGGNWCNPPGAGLGLRPTANTGAALLDAYLWIKVPGESDGSCDIAGGARAWDFTAYNPWNVPAATQNNFDPLWGMPDPAAGAWFTQQALELAQNATPPLF
jgi:endoglucanase